MGYSVMQEDWFTVFKFRVTVRAHLIMTVSTISAELLIFLQINSIGWYIIIGRGALCKKLIVCFQGQDHSEGSKRY